MQSAQKYWFPAKRYGWGWSFPTLWQGWVVLVVFVALISVGNVYLRHTPLALPYNVGLVGLLLAICWLKGEPPRWRSGGE